MKPHGAFLRVIIRVHFLFRPFNGWLQNESKQPRRFSFRKAESQKLKDAKFCAKVDSKYKFREFMCLWKTSQCRLSMMCRRWGPHPNTKTRDAVGDPILTAGIFPL